MLLSKTIIIRFHSLKQKVPLHLILRHLLLLEYFYVISIETVKGACDLHRFNFNRN